MSRATLLDVARAAGVDPSTASRILRGESGQRVREETRARILRAAADLDYRPNPIARGLRSARTYSLGILVPQLDNPVFAAAILGAEAAAEARGYSLLISHRRPGVSGAGHYRRLSEANRVDGLLVATLDEDRALDAELDAVTIPHVVLNQFRPSAPVCVVMDTRAAARIALDHLLSLGHRRIAHLAGRTGGFNAAQRLAGYEDALRAAGLSLEPGLVATAGYTAEGGAEAMRAILARGRPPSAVFAATLISAAGALGVLHEAGLRVPEDVSIISVHDAPLARLLYPPLTTVRLPTERMGYLAAVALADLVEGRQPALVAPLPPDGLIERGSTAPARS